jgi:peptidoglycan/xylan/chitin deacetylase (PgdA/CDA1 family)
VHISLQFWCNFAHLIEKPGYPVRLMNKILVLNYHGIEPDSGSLSADYDPVFSVKATEFARQLDYLHRQGIPVIGLDEWLSGTAGQRGGVVLTFDDGCGSDYTIARPMLARYGYRATFFVVTDRLQDQQKKWRQLREMASEGHTVGSHSVTHRYFTDLDLATQTTELCRSRQILEEQMGQPIVHFALPGGKYDASTPELARTAGYQSVSTTNFGTHPGAEQPFLINRWTIKMRTGLTEFEKITSGDVLTMTRRTIGSRAKKRIHRLLGNTMTDRLNYWFNS